MDRIEEMALLSIRRGLSYVMFAALTLMVGLSATPDVALKAGGCFLGVVSAAMAVRALSAGNFPYNRTEVWILIKDSPRSLPEDRLQRAIAEVRRRLYAHYARWTAVAAAALWTLGMVLAVVA